jgi:hypothetical protein
MVTPGSAEQNRPTTRRGVSDHLVGTALLAIFTSALALVAGCSESKSGKKCEVDTDCDRGTVCDVDSKACTSEPCTGIGDCSGSRRTCLADTQTCSAQECSACPDDANALCCANPGQVCITEGPNRFSCTGSVRCSEDSECGILGDAYVCCGGTCEAGCNGGDSQALTGDMSVIPGGDAAPMTGDAGGGGSMSTPDMAGPPPGDAAICTECTADADCAALGAGAECKSIDVGQYCTKPCMADADCPSPFVCKAGINLCLPARVLCGCFATGCEGGQVCDPATSQCTVPKQTCGACAEDSECAAGLKCGTVGAVKYCLPECGAGCAAGTTCDAAGVCTPDSGTCDACLGACAGATPVCVPGANGGPSVCAECGNGRACADASLRCDATNHCVAPQPGMGCVTDNDCAGGRCIAGECKECIEDRDCGVRRACNPNTFTCEDNPCGGVTCQGGSQCDANTGRCAPGCATDEDCGDPMAAFCDGQTGQCFNRDGTCDDMLAVCPAGSVCQPLIPIPGLPIPGNCTCLISDPSNPALTFCSAGDVVACAPGLVCNYGALPGQPPPPNGTCGADIFGICP